MSVRDMNPLTPFFESAFADMAAELGPVNVQILLQHASLVEVEPGRRLINDRMPVEFLYFVVEGELSAYLEVSGRRINLGRIQPGVWLGEISVLSGEAKASSTVEAVTACRLIRLHQRRFVDLIADNVDIAQVLLERFIDEMAKRMRTSIEHGEAVPKRQGEQ